MKLPAVQRSGSSLQLPFVVSLPGADPEPLVLRPAANTTTRGSNFCSAQPPGGSGSGPLTHGVSSITLHTVAIVLKQSVVFSMGRFLFCWQRWSKGENPVSFQLAPRAASRGPSPPTQTWSCRRLMSSAWAWRRRRTGICGWPVRC